MSSKFDKLRLVGHEIQSGVALRPPQRGCRTGDPGLSPHSKFLSLPFPDFIACCRLPPAYCLAPSLTVGLLPRRRKLTTCATLHGLLPAASCFLLCALADVRASVARASAAGTSDAIRPAFCRSIIHCGYIDGGAVVLDSSSISSEVNTRFAALRLSSNCDILFAPMMIEVTPDWASNQASATCATLAPFRFNLCAARLRDWDCRAGTCPKEIRRTRATREARRGLLRDKAAATRVRDPDPQASSKPAET